MAFGTDRSVLFREVSFIQGYPYRGIPPYTCTLYQLLNCRTVCCIYIMYHSLYSIQMMYIVMQETVEMLMKRFHGQMKAAPKLSLYDSDKGVGLQVPRETFSKMNITFTEDYV